MSKWNNFDCANRVREILSDAVYGDGGHHLGKPFLTPYQIALEFAERWPEDFEEMNLPIGGIGLGEKTSLAQYFGGQISQRIESGELSDFEGGFISNSHLVKMEFVDNQKHPVVSSKTSSGHDLSMFRLKDKNQ